MQSILIIVGLLVISLISLIFLYVFLKIIVPISEPYGLENNLSNNKELIDGNFKIDETSFRTGINQGTFIFQMSLYKLWVEGGESVVVGTFDNLQAEIIQTMSQLFSDTEKLKEWKEKFLKYVDSKKENPFK